MSEKEFNFSEMVCFSLYSASNAMIRKYRPSLEAAGLTYPQLLVMMSLWNKDSISIKELSNEVLLDASTLTQIVKRLENKGYIIKKVSETDDRARSLVVTESGRELKEQTSDIFSGMECLINLSSEEQEATIKGCHKILEKLR